MLGAHSTRRAFLSSAFVVGAALGSSLLAACQPTSSAAPTTAPAAGAKPTTAPPAASTTAPATGGAAPTSVKIGAVVPLTGRYAVLGEQVNNGYQLALKDLNAKGGVMVKALGTQLPLEISILDDASDANQTVQRFETHASQGAMVYVGGAGSDLHAAAAAVAEKNKIPYLGIAFALLSIHQQGYKYLFSPFPKSPQMAKAVFELMDTLNPKPTKIGIFAEKTDWGAEMENSWKQEAQQRGYSVVMDAQYAPASSDFSPMVLQAQQSQPDALLAVPSPPDGIAIIKQMKELDVSPKLLNFVRTSDNSSWTQALGKDGDYNILSTGWSTDLKFAGNPELLQGYQQMFNKPAEGLVGASYALMQVLADAVGRATAFTRDGIRDALASTDLKESVVGPISFNPDGTANMVTVLSQWQAGKQVGVWPTAQVGGAVQYPAKPFNQR